MPWFRHIARPLIKVILLFSDFKISGRQNIPRKGPLIVVANHVSLTDPPILSIVIDREMVFMAKHELFKPLVTGYLVREFGAFPVHRGRLDMTAMRQAEKVLGDGKALAMFPQGMRVRPPETRQVYNGAALIALRTCATILPVLLIGTEQINGVLWIFRRPHVRAFIGQPFILNKPDGKLTQSELNGMTAEIMMRIENSKKQAPNIK